MVKLYTSRWQNRALETAPVVAVGISRGAPRFRVGYRYRRLMELAPDGWMLSIESDERFEKVYRAKLNNLGVEKIGALLTKISDEEDGKALALLCYEADPARCHRSAFAAWWTEQTGQEVPELQNSVSSRKRQEGAQPSLFDALPPPLGGDAQDRGSDPRVPHGHH